MIQLDDPRPALENTVDHPDRDIGPGDNYTGGLVGAAVSVPGPYAFGGSSAGSGTWNLANSALNLIHGFNRVVDVLSAGAVGFDRVAFGGYGDAAQGSLTGESWWGAVAATLDVAAFVGIANLGTVGRSADTTRAISTYRYTQAGETFQHYGYSEHSQSLSGGLRPGSYATSAHDLSGVEAKTGLALPHANPPNAVYTVSPPSGTLIRVNPVTNPQFGQPGGLPEVEFILGTPPGSIIGPSPIPGNIP